MGYTARLTEALFSMMPCAGAVHSVFEKAVNVALYAGGDMRLLTLVSPDAPGLPDSVCLPACLRGQLETGMPAQLSPERLQLNGSAFALTRDGQWSGRMPVYGGAPRTGAFLALTAEWKTGFDLLPPQTRRDCERALLTAAAPRWLGLGPGLTPSFDDACVGVLALCRALGVAPPFRLGDLSATTDVSARYLRLAQEGYFSQPLLDTAAALLGHGELATKAAALRNVGATSGADMLYGMRLWLLAHEREKET